MRHASFHKVNLAEKEKTPHPFPSYKSYETHFIVFL